MKKIIFLLIPLGIFTNTYALPPSQNIIGSCLKVEAKNGVKLVAIPNNESYQEDNYKNGYSADFMTFQGKDIGYASKKNQHAVLYNKELFPIDKAQNIETSKSTIPPTKINPDLADWLLISENGNRFLCITDNFPGMGRSGSYQNVRYAYLLSLTGKKELYFTAGDIRDKHF